MTMLVTLAQVKLHLRLDTDDEDELVELLTHAASEAVLGYIRNGPDLFLDSAGDVIEDSNGDPIGIPYDVKAATLLLVGFLYRNRDADPDKDFSHGYLPIAVMSLLYRYRDPSLA